MKLKLNLKVVFVLIALMLSIVACSGMPEGLAGEVFEFPEMFTVAFLGFATYWITEGIKLVFPKLAGYGAQIASLGVAMILTLLSGLINTTVPASLYPILTQVFIFLATWLTSQGTFRFFKKFAR